MPRHLSQASSTKSYATFELKRNSAWSSASIAPRETSLKHAEHGVFTRRTFARNRGCVLSIPARRCAGRYTTCPAPFARWHSRQHCSQQCLRSHVATGGRGG